MRLDSSTTVEAFGALAYAFLGSLVVPLAKHPMPTVACERFFPRVLWTQTRTTMLPGRAGKIILNSGSDAQASGVRH